MHNGGFTVVPSWDAMRLERLPDTLLGYIILIVNTVCFAISTLLFDNQLQVNLAT